MEYNSSFTGEVAVTQTTHTHLLQVCYWWLMQPSNDSNRSAAHLQVGDLHCSHVQLQYGAWIRETVFWLQDMIRFGLRKKLLDCQRPRGKVKGKAQGIGKDLAINILAVINEPGEPSPAGKAHRLSSLAEPHQSPLRACESVTPPYHINIGTWAVESQPWQTRGFLCSVNTSSIHLPQNTFYGPLTMQRTQGQSDI